MFASSKVIRLEEIKIAVVPGKSFDLRYQQLRKVYDCILSSYDNTEVLVYLPHQEKPLSILGEDNVERCIKLQNKLHELTA